MLIAQYLLWVKDKDTYEQTKMKGLLCFRRKCTIALWYDVLNCKQSFIKVIRWMCAKYIRHTTHTKSMQCFLDIVLNILLTVCLVAPWTLGLRETLPWPIKYPMCPKDTYFCVG